MSEAGAEVMVNVPGFAAVACFFSAAGLHKGWTLEQTLAEMQFQAATQRLAPEIVDWLAATISENYTRIQGLSKDELMIGVRLYAALCTVHGMSIIFTEPGLPN